MTTTLAWIGASVGLGLALGFLRLTSLTGIPRFAACAVRGQLPPGRAAATTLAFSQAIAAGVWARSEPSDQRTAGCVVLVSLVLACLGHLMFPGSRQENS